VIAACRCGRNSIGVEIDPHYFRQAKARVHAEAATLIDSQHVIAFA
jgi:DNA modification methylase